MSLEDFKAAVTAWLQIENDNIKDLFASLPDVENDDPDACLRWPDEKTLSPIIMNALKIAGYEILSIPGHYLISFSKDRMREEDEDNEDDNRRERLRKTYH